MLGGWRNRPLGERSKYDVALQPHGTPCLTDLTVGKGDTIRVSRRPYNLRRHGYVQGITLLAQTGVFSNDIREWRQQSYDLKTLAKYKFFFTECTKSIK